jgi:hypothetical protein
VPNQTQAQRFLLLGFLDFLLSIAFGIAANTFHYVGKQRYCS